MLKGFIAILFFIVVFGLTFRLAYLKKLSENLTKIFLLFAILGGLVIANYDLIKRFKYKDFELETAVKEIAVQEVKKEVENQKESISLLIREMNQASSTLQEQSESLGKLISKADVTSQEMNTLNKDLISAKNDINIQRERIEKLATTIEETSIKIGRIFRLIQDLSLKIAKITYFYVETKSEIGTQRDKIARQKMIDELNELLPVVLPNSTDRATWIQQLEKMLPAREN